MTAAAVTGTAWAYPYTPSARQEVMHRLQPDELLFGGAAGGGKTAGLIAAAVTLCLLVPGAKALVLRRTFPQLEQEVIPRLREAVPEHIAHYYPGSHTMLFKASGARLLLGHLETAADVYNYQGAEFQLVCWDELTQFQAWEYDYLSSRVRAAGAVANRMRNLGLRPRMMSTANPGGIGHTWVRRRFVDPGIRDRVFQGIDDEGNPEDITRAYVPAKATDNPHLDLDAYMRRLSRLDPTLRRALRDGDWDILEGVRFGQWRDGLHTVEPGVIDVPLIGYPRAVGVDYGSTAPFVALWGVRLNDGLIYVYRELYRTGLTPRQQAELMLQAEEHGERLPSRPIRVALDPSTWAHAATDPVAQVMGDIPPVGSIARPYWEAFGGSLVKARNDRKAGAALIDEGLLVRDDGFPRLIVSRDCPNLIRTLPTLVRSRTEPEDVSQHPVKQDDHAYDALRYLLMELVMPGHDRVQPDRGNGHVAGTATAGLHPDAVIRGRTPELTTSGLRW